MTHSFDEFEFDAGSLELKRDGRPVQADALLLRILAVLVGRAGQLVTKQDLVAEVWGARVVTDNAVTVAIARLRKLLGHERGTREFIVTVHARGYRFIRELGPSQSHPSLAHAGARAERLSFVGRERVLRQLAGALDEAREGRGRACMLLGEAGIGKTRAVEMLASAAVQAGVPVAWGYCREVGDTPPLWPFAQLVRELRAKVPLGPDEQVYENLIAQLTRVAPEQRSAAPQVDRSGVVSPHLPKYKLFDATARVLAMAARNSPCILILDDLHRADPASLELLRYLIDELAITRIALYGMVRSSEKLHPHLSYVLGHQNVARILLEPLTEPDVASYVTSVLHRPHPALASAVFRKSEGNPFLMTELLRHVREQDQGIDPETLHVPDVALQLVRQRAAMLDDAARGVLSRAAVIGRRFDLAALHAVSGVSANALMTTLDEALNRGLVISDPNSTTTFAFSHELLRSALYNALPRRERRELHLRVAEALEQRSVAGEAVPSADLAYHYRAALPTSQPRKVVEYCRAAAKEAAYVHSYGDAARYLSYAQQGLDLLEHSSPRLRMALMAQQAMYLHARSPGQAEPLIRSAIAFARAQKAGVQLAHAAFLLDAYRGFPSAPDARELFEEALQLLPPDETATRAGLLAVLGATPPIAYDAAQVAAHLGKARAMANASGAPIALYLTRLAELYLSYGPEQRLGAEEALDEIDRLSRNAISITMQPILREGYRAIAALQDGDTAAMNAAIGRGEAYCRDVDSKRLWQFERCRILARINAGDNVDAPALLEALHRRVRSNATAITEFFCAYDECVVLRNPGKLPKYVLRDVFGRAAGDPPNIWAMKVRALATAGLHDEAHALLALVPPDRLASLPHDRDYLGTLGALARAVLDLQLRDYADALHPLLARYPDRFAANLSFFSEGRTSELMTLLERMRGERSPSARPLRLRHSGEEL